MRAAEAAALRASHPGAPPFTPLCPSSKKPKAHTLTALQTLPAGSRESASSRKTPGKQWHNESQILITARSTTSKKNSVSRQCCAAQPRCGQKHQLTEEHHSIPSPGLHPCDRGGTPTEGQRWATMFHSSAAPGAHGGSLTQAGAGSTTALSPRGHCCVRRGQQGPRH